MKKLGYEDIGFGFFTYTPEVAREILEHRNPTNRKIGSVRVDAYARQIANGTWRAENPATISFDGDGNLLDGQHRLAAIVQTGIATTVRTVTGVPREAMSEIDTGRPRSASDVLAISGFKNTTTLAAAIKRMILWDKSPAENHKMAFANNSGSYICTNTEILAYAVDHPEFQDDTKLAARLTDSSVRMNGARTSVLVSKMRSVSKVDADYFFDRLRNGGPDTPQQITILREYMLRDAASRARKKPNPMIQSAVTIKAWNAWMRGDEIKQLKFAVGGAHPDSFPAIEGVA